MYAYINKQHRINGENRRRSNINEKRRRNGVGMARRRAYGENGVMRMAEENGNNIGMA